MTFKWDTDAKYHKPVPTRIDPAVWGPSDPSKITVANVILENDRYRKALKEIAKIILRELDR